MQVFWDLYSSGVLYGTHWGAAPNREPSNQDVDQYERPRRKLVDAKSLLEHTNSQLIQLKELAQTTVRFGADKAILERLETLSGRFKFGEVGMSRKALVEYRQQIRASAVEIVQMRKDIFCKMLRALSKDTRAHLRALVGETTSEHQGRAISRSSMNRRVLETLFNNQLDLMCAFNIVEKLRRHNVEALVRQKRCQLTDFVKIGEHHYWIHDEGLRVLKEFLKVKDAL